MLQDCVKSRNKYFIWYQKRLEITICEMMPTFHLLNHYNYHRLVKSDQGLSSNFPSNTK